MDSETLLNLLFWVVLIAGIFLYQYTHPRNKESAESREDSGSSERSITNRGAKQQKRSATAVRATAKTIGVIIGVVFILGLSANIAVAVWGPSIISNPLFLFICCVAVGLVFQRFIKR